MSTTHQAKITPTSLPATTGDRVFDLDLVEFHIKKVCGNVLTVVEASYSDKEQRDAVRDLVKKEFNRQLDAVRLYAGASGQEHAPAA